VQLLAAWQAVAQAPGRCLCPHRSLAGSATLPEGTTREERCSALCSLDLSARFQCSIAVVLLYLRLLWRRMAIASDQVREPTRDRHWSYPVVSASLHCLTWSVCGVSEAPVRFEELPVNLAANLVCRLLPG
jgi:hypothetical protein